MTLSHRTRAEDRALKELKNSTGEPIHAMSQETLADNQEEITFVAKLNK